MMHFVCKLPENVLYSFFLLRKWPKCCDSSSLTVWRVMAVSNNTFVSLPMSLKRQGNVSPDLYSILFPLHHVNFRVIHLMSRRKSLIDVNLMSRAEFPLLIVFFHVPWPVVDTCGKDRVNLLNRTRTIVRLTAQWGSSPSQFWISRSRIQLCTMIS